MSSPLLCRSAAAIVAVAGALGPLFARLPDDPPEYSLREWHMEDGLPNEDIHDVVQDRSGYLWIATSRGLTRFNGIRFDLVTRPGVAGGPAFLARAIVDDPGHGLLFAATTNGALEWGGDALRSGAASAPYSNKLVATWFAQADGTLWSACLNGEIDCLRGGKLSEVKPEDSRLLRRPISFAEDAAGGMWIAAATELFKCENGRLSRIPLPFGDTELQITSSRRGGPWMITHDRVGRWNGNGLDSPVKLPDLLGAHFVHALLEDHDGSLWVGTRSQGAYRVAGGQYRTVPTSHRTINALCQDRQGDLWLATGGGGLDRLQPKLFELFDSKSGLRDDLTLSVCEDRAGRIWFANRDGGAARIVDGVVEVMAGKPGWPSSLAGRVFPDRLGGIWLSGGAGLFKADRDGTAAQRVGVVNFRNIRVIFATRDDDLWLAGDAGELGRLDRTGFTRFGQEAGFPRQQACCIAEDPEGRVLVGTAEGQLLRLGGTAFAPLPDSVRGPRAPILAVFAEKGGVIWVATAGAGLDVIAGGRDHYLNSTSGLPDNTISQLLFDDRGGVWFGSWHGIFSIERREILDFVTGATKTVHASVFGKNEGLGQVSCLDGYQPNSWKARNGTLWFTTRKGVLTINPGNIRARGTAPVRIDELRVDDSPCPLASAAAIRADAHKIELRYSVFDLAAPERVAVRYRLEGFDRDWIDGRADRQIVYPGLLPGSYRLQIEVADDEGAWNAPGTSLAVAVIPFWWQTLWLRLVAGILLVAVLVGGGWAWSHRRLRLKLERMERESAVDRERARIAQDIHDEVGASLTQISLLAQRAPPDASVAEHRTCLEQIYATTTAITRAIEEIVWAVDTRHDNLDSLACYFGNYAQGFLGAARIRCRLDIAANIPDVVIESQIRHHLFLAFKEALNNCVKHAKATEVVVRIGVDAACLAITISDNGRGLRTNGAEHPAADSGHPPRASHGMQNLEQRLAAIGGEFRLSRGDEGGTVARLSVPISRALA